MQQEEEEEEEVDAWQHQWVRLEVLIVLWLLQKDIRPLRQFISRCQFYRLSMTSATRRMHCYVTMPLPSFLLLSESV